MFKQWSNCVLAFAEWLEETIEQSLTVFQLPKNHHDRLRTTNIFEKFHQEVKRRTRVVRILPNRSSCLRVASALAVEQLEKRLPSPGDHTMAQTETVEEPDREGALQPVV